jgi:hypothetical protein
VRKQIGIIIIIAQVFFLAMIQAFAQQTPGQPNPSIPDDVLGSQLIAWSQLQKPEPVMQGQSQEQRPVHRSDQPSSPAQTFTDRTDTDRANQDGNRLVPSVTNGVLKFEGSSAKHQP